MSQKKYIASRIIQTIFLIWFVLTFLFFFFRLLPGSFIDLLIFRGATPEAIQHIKAKWGLNEPLYIQYGKYLWNFIHFDAGTSLKFREPVWEVVKMRMFNSFILIAPAITLSYIVGSLVGLFLGLNRGSKFEKRALVPIILSGSFPSFFTAILLIVVFAGWLNLFPTSGMFTPGTVQSDIWWKSYLTWDFAAHYFLPFLAVFLRYLALPALISRTSVVEVLGQGFIGFHRVTGLSKFNQLKHIGKHASLPVITLYPVSMTRALGGLVLIETVFNWPGIGFTLVQSVLSRDFPVVQFVFFVIAAFVIISNFLIDIVYGIIDPRISIED